RDVHRALQGWRLGDVIEVRGALRRRTWWGGEGFRSVCEVEAGSVALVRSRCKPVRYCHRWIFAHQPSCFRARSVDGPAGATDGVVHTATHKARSPSNRSPEPFNVTVSPSTSTVHPLQWTWAPSRLTTGWAVFIPDTSQAK